MYQDFEELIANARRAALFAKKLGVKIVWEWPKPCALWNEDLTEQLVAELGLTKLNIAGCNFGLKAQNPKHVAELIRKQWTLATDYDAVIAHFSGRDCKCSGNQTPCEGRDTKLSEHYTPSLAAAFHQCADPHFSNAKEVSAANSRRGSPELGREPLHFAAARMTAGREPAETAARGSPAEGSKESKVVFQNSKALFTAAAIGNCT